MLLSVELHARKQPFATKCRFLFPRKSRKCDDTIVFIVVQSDFEFVVANMPPTLIHFCQTYMQRVVFLGIVEMTQQRVLLRQKYRVETRAD